MLGKIKERVSPSHLSQGPKCKPNSDELYKWCASGQNMLAMIPTKRQTCKPKVYRFCRRNYIWEDNTGKIKRKVMNTRGSRERSKEKI